MFKAFEIDVQMVLKNPTLFSNTKYGDYEKTTRIELVKQDERDILRAHFSWQPEYHLYIYEEEQARRLKEIGFVAKESKETETSRAQWLFYIKQETTRHLWFMNFRRYGWCWTSEKDGEDGYTRGDVYANGCSISNLATTPQEVVRDALVSSWTQLKCSGRLPPVFFSRESEACLRHLLNDALKHISEHARPGYNNGPAASYVPVMAIHTPDLDVEQGIVAIDYGSNNPTKPLGLFGV